MTTIPISIRYQFIPLRTDPQRTIERLVEGHPMLITQKHKYALRAIFELGKRYEDGPVKLAEVAEAQAIPQRFLEVIMAELKPSGIVTSKRGYYGGYILLHHPQDVTVGDIFRFLDDTQSSDHCSACDERETCPLHGDCAFMAMWEKVQDAIYTVYDETTIQDLLQNERGLQPITATMPNPIKIDS